MQARLLEIVLERLTESDLSPDESNLVFAACQGEAALQNWLQEGQAPVLDGGTATVRAGSGVYLNSVRVQGFRGIGPSLELKLQPGPGLTLVVGRNGSGKSSLAEALELLLTGRSARWEDRSSIWKSAWRNLHDPIQPKILAEFTWDGGKIQLNREWKQDAEMDASTFTAQPASQLEEQGWKAALEDYRPFLSHNELSTLLLREPSKLYDALYKILGLGDLTLALERLANLRKQDEAASKLLKSDLSSLKARLAQSGDPRAQTAAKELGRRSIDWNRILTQCGTSGGSQEEIAKLRQLAEARFPDFEQPLQKLCEALDRQKRLQEDEEGRSHQLAELLRAALVYQQSTAASGTCPVCRNGQLDDNWAARTGQQLTELELRTQNAKQLKQEIGRLEDELRALATGPCPAEELTSAWQHWQNTRNYKGAELVDHLRTPTLGELRARLAVLSREAQERLEKLESEWLPLAQQLANLAEQARRNQPADERARRLKVAEDWLKGVAEDIRLCRFAPIAQGMRQFWSTMRQDSNVELVEILLTGQKTNRRVEVQVKVDDTENAALGVMSQGELNSLALSLFLPRATQPESPFRFLCIDDPVQAMDPAKVDGLARALEQVSKSHQVLVFTHDSRLYEAVLRLGIRAEVLEVTRRARSVVELRKAHDPIDQALGDARALALTQEMPERVSRKVVPNFCRRALEICFTDLYRRKRPFSLEDYDRADTLNKKASLAFFGSLDQVQEVGNHLRRFGPAADAYHQCNRGSHGGFEGDLHRLIDQTRELVGKLRSQS